MEGRKEHNKGRCHRGAEMREGDNSWSRFVFQALEKVVKGEERRRGDTGELRRVQESCDGRGEERGAKVRKI